MNKSKRAFIYRVLSSFALLFLLISPLSFSQELVSEHQICPSPYGIDWGNECKAICPEGTYLIRPINPNTGEYLCRSKKYPKVICRYVNPNCLNQNLSSKWVKSIYEDTAKKSYWAELGRVITDVNPNGEDFMRFLVRILTLDPQLWSKIWAYWGKLNNTNSDFPYLVKFVSLFISILTKYVAIAALVLSSLVGGIALTYGFLRKKKEGEDRGLDGIGYALEWAKIPVITYLSATIALVAPFPHKIVINGENYYYRYPLVIDVMRDILLFGNEMANRISHELNLLLLDYEVQRHLKSVVYLANLEQQLANRQYAYAASVWNTFMIPCMSQYGLKYKDWLRINYDSLDDLAAVHPKQNPINPYICKSAADDFEDAMQLYYARRARMKYYEKLAKDILEDTGFRDLLVKKMVIGEKQFGWLSTAMFIYLYYIYADEIIQERIKDMGGDLQDQLDDAREEYLKLTYNPMTELNPPPWYKEYKDKLKTITGEENAMGRFMFTISKVMIVDSLPPGSFIYNFLKSVIVEPLKIGEGSKEDSENLIQKFISTVFSFIQYIPGANKIMLIGSSLSAIIKIGLTIAVAILAYFITILLLSILPFVAIFLSTLFRIAVYTYQIASAVFSAPFLVLHAPKGDMGRHFVNFVYKVIDISLVPIYTIAGIGLSIFIIAVLKILFEDLPGIFLGEYYRLAWEKGTIQGLMHLFIDNGFYAIFFYFSKILGVLAAVYIVYNAPEIIKSWAGSFSEYGRQRVIDPLREYFEGRFFKF